MRSLAILALTVLCACGADDEPEPVNPSIGGEARVGVVGSF